MLTEPRPYNERLFSGGIRARLHMARFRWLAEVTRRLDTSSVFELGCFDAKSIPYLPQRPTRYVGADANWEGGLSLARQRWPQYTFLDCSRPEELERLEGPFSVSLCMETLEHVPPEFVDGYLDQLARLTSGHLIVTVPIEKGPVFLGKHLAKIFSRSLSEGDGNVAGYTAGEVVCATLGLTRFVHRNEHKGFDYNWLARKIRERFRILEYSGHPFALAPRWLNFGIGIVAESR